MTISNILALAIAMLFLAVIPGPGVMATVARALTGGFRPAASVAGGIVLGDLIFLLAAIYGLSFIAEILGTFFIVVKFVGGGYLIWLGVRMLLTPGEDTQVADTSDGTSSHSDFLSGLAITFGNPKVIVFYLSFLPAFMDLRSLSSIDVIIAASVVSIVLGAVMLSYAIAAAKTRSIIKGAKTVERMNQAGGAMLMGSGALLIAKSQ